MPARSHALNLFSPEFWKERALRVARRLGYEITRRRVGLDGLPVDFTDREKAICEKVRAHTMTSPERVQALVQAVEYVTKAGLPGAIIECGVADGGSILAA